MGSTSGCRNSLPCIECRREDSNLHSLYGNQVLNLIRPCWANVGVMLEHIARKPLASFQRCVAGRGYWPHVANAVTSTLHLFLERTTPHHPPPQAGPDRGRHELPRLRGVPANGGGGSAVASPPATS